MDGHVEAKFPLLTVACTALRHNVNQSEGMARYGWTTYDTREGGRQIIEDVGNKINLTTEFVKHSDGQGAGNWGLRIRGIPRPDAPSDLKTTIVFYVGMESMNACATCKLEAHPRLGDGVDTAVHAVDIELAHPVLGSAGIHIGVPVNNEGASEGASVKTLNVTEDRLWQAKCEYSVTDVSVHLYRGELLADEVICKKPRSWML